MNLIITIVFVLLFSYFFTLLTKRINIPVVVALIISGLIMSVPYLRNIIIEPNTLFILKLGNVGLICLMFLAGLESSWKALYAEKKRMQF